MRIRIGKLEQPKDEIKEIQPRMSSNLSTIPTPTKQDKQKLTPASREVAAFLKKFSDKK